MTKSFKGVKDPNISEIYVSLYLRNNGTWSLIHCQTPSSTFNECPYGCVILDGATHSRPHYCKGQDTVRYCIILSVSIYLFMEPYKGYKSAIIFSLPELIKQRLLQGKISNFITRDIVEGNLTKQKPEFYQKGQ